MRTQQRFASLLLHNLRLSFFVTVGVTGLVAAYALIRHVAPEWQVVLFVAIGMILSSVINALFDVRRDNKPHSRIDAQ